MPLLVLPVCAGETLYCWGGNISFGVEDALVQSEHFISLEEGFCFVGLFVFFLVLINPAITYSTSSPEVKSLHRVTMEVNFRKFKLRAINALVHQDELALLVLETFPSIKKLGYRKTHLYIQE